jgi:predicted dienelactone hydrolase
VAGQAIIEAPYNLSAGPYPLVLLSSGFIIGRTGYARLAEHLASHGFVVIAPEHQERFDQTISEFWPGAITRPQDVLTVLDYAEEQAGARGALQGLIDIHHVAVIGYSYGGYTSLVMAGARFDIASLEALCETAREAGDPNVWLCDLIVPHVDEMAALAGYDSIPEGLWPAWGDSRVDAIVPMADDAFFFNQAGLAEITVPVMAIGGTADNGAPYLWECIQLTNMCLERPRRW